MTLKRTLGGTTKKRRPRKKKKGTWGLGLLEGMEAKEQAKKDDLFKQEMATYRKHLPPWLEKEDIE